MYSTDNGGVDWFVSHSLEGTTDEVKMDDADGSAENNSGPVVVGGAAGADVSSLARRVADMAQSSTQTLGGRYGRMLSVSRTYWFVFLSKEVLLVLCVADTTLFSKI